MNTYPVSFKVVLFFFFSKQSLGERCYTPDKQTGYCVPLNECPQLFETFANPLQGSEAHLRRFLCQDEQQLKVCCDTAANFTLLDNYSTIDPPEISRKIIDRDAFPECYLNSLSTVDLPIIITESLDSDVELKKCLGILANSRYVITPAQCVVSNAQRQQFTVVGVKLRGKSNNSVTFGVEEIIPHPFFDAVTGVNDISLLRLNQTVSNEDVAALCKIILWNNASPVGRPIFVYTDLDLFTIERGLNKTTVNTTSLSKEECKEKFLQKSAHAVVTEFDLCTDNLQNATKTTCKEFIGVPIFIQTYGTIGFIGFSSSRTVCDDDLPDIYTNVDAYKGWLREHMRPWPTKSDPCTTPNGQVGECWHVLHCPSLLDAFSDVTTSTEAHLREFICERGEEGEFSVCCVTSSNSTLIHRKDEAEPAEVPTKFLEARLCGLQHRDDYFSSSTAVAIDEFPWIAIIESSFSRCTGTLINSRYVLTTGHCVAVDMDTTIVRLGDYYRFNDTSCVKDPDVEGIDCTETEKYGVEDIIQHPFYIPLFSVNDIGLLRLNKTVSYYTDYVRPICLPIPGTLTAKVGDTLYMSSWGSQDDRSRQGIKKKVLTQLIEMTECQRQLRRQTAFNYIKHFNRICTTDYQNNTEFATVSDEGGPLMFHNNYRWHIEGLVFEIIQSRNLPVVYVNVLRYINWIVKSMKPWYNTTDSFEVK